MAETVTWKPELVQLRPELASEPEEVTAAESDLQRERRRRLVLECQEHARLCRVVGHVTAGWDRSVVTVRAGVLIVLIVVLSIMAVNSLELFFPAKVSDAEMAVASAKAAADQMAAETPADPADAVIPAAPVACNQNAECMARESFRLNQARLQQDLAARQRQAQLRQTIAEQTLQREQTEAGGKQIRRALTFAIYVGALWMIVRVVDGASKLTPQGRAAAEYEGLADQFRYAANVGQLGPFAEFSALVDGLLIRLERARGLAPSPPRRFWGLFEGRGDTDVFESAPDKTPITAAEIKEAEDKARADALEGARKDRQTAMKARREAAEDAKTEREIAASIRRQEADAARESREAARKVREEEAADANRDRDAAAKVRRAEAAAEEAERDAVAAEADRARDKADAKAQALRATALAKAAADDEADAKAAAAEADALAAAVDDARAELARAIGAPRPDAPRAEPPWVVDITRSEVEALGRRVADLRVKAYAAADEARAARAKAVASRLAADMASAAGKTALGA